MFDQHLSAPCKTRLHYDSLVVLTWHTVLVYGIATDYRGLIRETVATLFDLAVMPNSLGTHVLTVDANVIHKVDTANPANLYSMWTGEYIGHGLALDHLGLLTNLRSLLPLCRLSRTRKKIREPQLAPVAKGAAC